MKNALYLAAMLCAAKAAWALPQNNVASPAQTAATIGALPTATSVPAETTPCTLSGGTLNCPAAGPVIMPVAVVPRSTLIPSVHLAKFLASSTPTVCIVGDSTSTLNANHLVADDLLWPILERRMREDNPAKTINFQNYAIGGTAWSSFLTTQVAGTNYPTFYFNTALPWAPYVQAADCDTLFVNWGINDNRSLIANTMRVVLTNIVGWGTAPAAWAASTAYTLGTVVTDSNGRLEEVSTAGTSSTGHPTWPTTPIGSTVTDGGVTWTLLQTVVNVPKIPDIVLFTNKNANPLAGAPFSTQPYQSGYLSAASIQRTLAMSGQNLGITNLPKLGLIDIGRYFTEAVYGEDPAEQYFTQSVSTPITGISTFPYLTPSTDGDFDMTWTIPGAGMTAAGTTIQFNLGSADGSGTAATTLLNLTNPTTATQVNLVYYASGGGVPATLFSNATIWTTGNNTVELIGHSTNFQAYVNGTLMIDANLPCTITQGLIGIAQVVNPPSGFAVTLTTFNSATMRKYTPLIGMNDCYGPVAGPYPSGGQGSVHDSSLCINLVDAHVLEATRFAP